MLASKSANNSADSNEEVIPANSEPNIQFDQGSNLEGQHFHLHLQILLYVVMIVLYIILYCCLCITGSGDNSRFNILQLLFMNHVGICLCSMQ